MRCVSKRLSLFEVKRTVDNLVVATPHPRPLTFPLQTALFISRERKVHVLLVPD